jgi:hypothetical protein
VAEFAVTGGCRCHAVRYRVTAPADEVCHCHCSICRRVHGAAFASFAIVPPGNFIITAGADRLTRYDSTPGVQRYFCSRCGAQIYGDVDKLPDIRFYTIGTPRRRRPSGPRPGQRAPHLCRFQNALVAHHGRSSTGRGILSWPARALVRTGAARR